MMCHAAAAVLHRIAVAATRGTVMRYPAVARALFWLFHVDIQHLRVLISCIKGRTFMGIYES
jgi:hypothetical protein